MLKFWAFVFFSVLQITMVVPFIFPDDDYFKQAKPTPAPNYANNRRSRQFVLQNQNFNLNSVIFKSCMESCPTTPEFDPVCGTNMETYYNKGKLGCAKRCVMNVQLYRIGRCRRRGQFDPL